MIILFFFLDLNCSLPKVTVNNPVKVINDGRKLKLESVVMARRMLSPKKFLQRRRKIEVFKDAEDEVDQKNWRGLMKQIQDTNGSSVVSFLKKKR